MTVADQNIRMNMRIQWSQDSRQSHIENRERYSLHSLQEEATKPYAYLYEISLRQRALPKNYWKRGRDGKSSVSNFNARESGTELEIKKSFWFSVSAGRSLK